MGKSSKKPRRKGPPPPVYVDPERAKIYARFGTDITPPAPVVPGAAEGEAPISSPAPVVAAVREQIVADVLRERQEKRAAEQATLAFLEAEARAEAEARELAARAEQEALLLYLIAA